MILPMLSLHLLCLQEKIEERLALSARHLLQIYDILHVKRLTIKVVHVRLPTQASGGSRISPRWGCQYMTLPKLPKNCMKLKEFGPQGRPKFYYVDPPLQAQADLSLLSFKYIFNFEGVFADIFTYFTKSNYSS